MPPMKKNTAQRDNYYTKPIQLKSTDLQDNCCKRLIPPHQHTAQRDNYYKTPTQLQQNTDQLYN